MTPLTQRQKELITKNVLAACKDINKLTKTGYNFLYLSQGFIAQYSLQGFKDYYSDGSLQRDIERNARANQWSNFRKGERDADYFHAKRYCYNMILGGLVARDELDAQNFMRDHFTIVHIA